MPNVVEIQRGIAELDRQREDEEAKELMLKPFKPTSAPYNREVAAREVEMGLYQGVAGMLRAGCALVLLKEHESRQTFAEMVEMRFRIPERTARYLRRFAKFCMQSPKFREVFGNPGMVSKGMNLLSGLTDPEIEAELDRFEETGELLGQSEIDLQMKSARELKAENRRLRLGQEKAVLKATDRLERENRTLRFRLEEAEAAAGGEGLAAALKLLACAEAQLTEGLAKLAKVNGEELAADAGGVARARMLIDRVRRSVDFFEASVFSGAAGPQE